MSPSLLGVWVGLLSEEEPNIAVEGGTSFDDDSSVESEEATFAAASDVPDGAFANERYGTDHVAGSCWPDNRVRPACVSPMQSLPSLTAAQIA